MASSPRPTLDSYATELQALEDYRNFSAITIQRYYRGWIIRRRQARQKTPACSSRQPKQQQPASARLYKAAKAIQDAWRSFNNSRIYSYYRDLIRFREAGDPRHMLRCINAREAALLDPAAGLHVRFRLGGSSFPPLVFYKIYTHRPVTDIGAFGPRDYASESFAAHSPAVSHNKQDPAAPGSATASTSGRQQQQQQPDEEFELPAKLREYIKPDGSLGYRSTKGWYRRVDRNGWRPVAERLLLDQEHQAALPASLTSSSSSSKRRRRKRLALLQLSGLQDAAGGAGACDCGDKQQRRQQQQQGVGSGMSGDWEAGSCDDEGSEASSSGSSSPVYHYSPTVRREDRARKLKQRRRQWLLNMYRAGMHASAAGAAAAGAGGAGGAGSMQNQGLAAASGAGSGSQQASASTRRSSGNSEEEQLLQLLEQQLLQDSVDVCGAGPGSSAAAAAGGDDADWEVEELVALGLDAGVLAWSQRLDFASYQQHWNSTVSLGSEVLVPQSEKALLQQLQQQQRVHV